MTKFTWVLKDPSSLKSNIRRSDTFETGGCTWSLAITPIKDNLCLDLDVSNGPSLRSGCKRCVKYRLTLVNHLSDELSLLEEGANWFDSRVCKWGYGSIIPFEKVYDVDGYIFLDELEIVAEVDVLEIPVEIDGAVSNDLIKEASSVNECMDVNGFKVLPSQVESVKRIFERHPDIAVGFRAKNQHMRKACMSCLLSLVETLCQSLQELSNEDLVEAHIALTYVKDAGFKVDWLEKKLDQAKERKEKELSGLAMLQETEENLLKRKRECAELDALAEKQKAELSSMRTPMSFDDVV